MAALSQSSKLLTIVLMFIGGSSGSTAGGIKSVTMVVLRYHVWYNLRGKKDGRIFGRRFEEEAVKKAGMVLLNSLLMADHAFSRNEHLMVIGRKEDIDRLLRKL